MKYFIILSEGAYSDYEPFYFMGNYKIAQEELTKKALNIRDNLIKEYEKLPERMEIDKYTERYEKIRFNPKTQEEVLSPAFNEFLPVMSKWLKEKGFIPLPKEIPEVNWAYGELTKEITI